MSRCLRIGLPIILSIIFLVIGLAFTLPAKPPATTMTVTMTPTAEQAYTTTGITTGASSTTSIMPEEAGTEYPEAPSLQLREYGSDRIVTLEDFKDRPVFLEFFSPYCPHCLNMMPRVEQLYEKYGDRVIFIMVSYGEKGVGEVKEKYNLRPIILVDPDGKVFERYGVWGVPTFFILDEEHRILWSRAGEADSREFEEVLTSILES